VPVHAYGPDPQHVGELFLPAALPAPVAVVLHGGFWRDRYDRHLMDDLCGDLAGRGWAAWNLEYRRLGSGGGWPATFDDVAAGIDALAGLDGLDLRTVVTVGHSAGGHLALWAAARPLARVRVTHAVSQAGVADLAEAHRLGLSRTVVGELLGGSPGELPAAYAAASPAELLPLGVPQLLVHGAEDEIVPLSIARRYAAAAAAAGDAVELVELPGVDHFEHLEPGSAAWAAVTRTLQRLSLDLCVREAE
jgi:acetyl esterase/lipase